MYVVVLLFCFSIFFVGMIGYDFLRIYLRKKKDAKLEMKKKKLEKFLLRGMQQKEDEQKSHFNRRCIYRKLLSLDYLEAFREMLDEKPTIGSFPNRMILSFYRESFDLLCHKMSKKCLILQAYFASFLKQIELDDTASRSFLLSSLRSHDLSVVESAMGAIIALGDEQFVLQALEVLEEESFFYHYKLLSEVLARFVGDLQKLGVLFLESFASFSANYQISFVIFFRLAQVDCRAQMLDLLKDRTIGKELRLQTIRYFSQIVDKRVKKILFHLLEEEKDFEYRVVIATTLEKYPGRDTVSVLCEQLCDSNYYVRYRAATSLSTLVDITKIKGITDTYAKEVLSYVVEKRRDL